MEDVFTEVQLFVFENYKQYLISSLTRQLSEESVHLSCMYHLTMKADTVPSMKPWEIYADFLMRCQKVPQDNHKGKQSVLFYNNQNF